MVAEIIASALVMTAEKINNLVTRYPSFKTLALLFLVLLGGLLMAEGFAIHINKGYVYFAMAFGLVLELCHIQLKNKQRRTIQRIRPMHQPTVVYGPDNLLKKPLKRAAFLCAFLSILFADSEFVVSTKSCICCIGLNFLYKPPNPHE